MNNYYVYILTNKTTSVLYIGVTNDLIRRLFEHKNSMIPGFTSKYNCNTLIYFEDTTDITAAIAREKQLKGWSRVKKENLINSTNPAWNDLYESLIG